MSVILYIMQYFPDKIFLNVLLIAISIFNHFSSETHNLPKQPPLALAMGQATQCLGLMARSGIGSCAFATVEDYLH